MEDQTPIDSISVTSRRPLWLRIRQKIRPYLSFGAIGLLIIAVLVPISIALGTPTPEEVMEAELVALGQDWAKWGAIRTQSLETAERALKEQIDLHERAEAIRTVFK